jgi:hypothetical protein
MKISPLKYWYRTLLAKTSHLIHTEVGEVVFWELDLHPVGRDLVYMELEE